MFATTNRSWAALTTNTAPRPERRLLDSARVDLLDGGEIVGCSGYRRLSGGDRRLSRPHHSLLRIAMSDRDVHVQRTRASCSRELYLYSSCLGRREDVRPPFFGHGCGSLNVPLGAYFIVDEHI